MNSQYSQSFSQSATMSRNLLRNVYLWMTIGLAITAVTAFGVASNPSFIYGLGNSGFMILMFVEIGLVWFLSARIMTMSPTTATIAFGAYSILNGLTLSVIFLAYQLPTVAVAFATTAGMFAAMSIYGSITRNDLSSWGSYLFMGIVGVLIASLVNMLLRSSALSYIISYAGVALFMALTAYDTQQIKRMSDALSEDLNEPDYIRLSIMGALKLYLDFINIFLFLLRIFGGSRR